MGRNKNPEETQERIVDAAIKLFIEKGYEQTTIQDILDALNLSKGGLYHHFKSKEEILEVVKQKRAQCVTDMLREIIEKADGANAKEKLKNILYLSATNTEIHSFDAILTSRSNEPHFVVDALQNTVNQDAPIIAKLIESGLKDGSLQTAQPVLCAEVFLLLFNYWASPVLFKRSLVETKERLTYLQSLLCLMGLEIIDDDFIESVINRYKAMGML